MKVKNIFLKLTAIAFLGAFSLKAEIPVTQIRGLASILNQDKQYLSPVWGAVLWNSPYVENLYLFGLPTSATVKLARSIFFVHHDEVTFDVTSLPTKIANYFTPYLIGQLVGLIDNFYNPPENPEIAKTQQELDAKKEEIKQKTIELREQKLSKREFQRKLFSQNQELFAQIRDLNSQLNTLKKTQNPIAKFKEELENCVTAFEIENQDRIQEKIKIYYEEKYIPKISRSIKNIENNITKAKQELQKKEERGYLTTREYEKMQQKRKYLKQLEESKIPHIHKLQIARNQINLGIKCPAYKQYKDEFLNHLVKSLNETNLFIPNNTIFLLLSSLWKTANTKDDFLQYFKGLHNKSNKKEKLFNNQKFIEDGFDQDFFEYHDDYYIKLKDAKQEDVKTKYINNIEALATLYLGYNLFDNPLPPEVPMIGGVKYKRFSFPDCGSTSLRNFFNAILYNPKTKEFDLGYLKGFDVNPKFKDFYTQKYKDVKKIKTKQAHDDWASVTSCLPGVSYLKGEICEISAGIKNMQKVIQNLVGTKTFEKLAEKLTQNKIELKIKYKNNKVLDKNNKVTFNIKQPLQSFEIIWSFFPGHFHTKVSLKDGTRYQYYENELKNLTGLNNYDTEKQIIFFDLFSLEFTEILETINEKINSDLLIPYTYFTILIQNMYTPEKILSLLNKIIENKILDQNPKLLIEFARSTYNRIPFDEHIQESYFSAIFRSKLKIFDPTKKPFNELREYNKYAAMRKFLDLAFYGIAPENQILIEWIQVNLPPEREDLQGTQESYYNLEKRKMMRSILNSSAKDKKLISWVKENLDKVNADPDYFQILIQSILKKHNDSIDLIYWVKDKLNYMEQKNSAEGLLIKVILDKYSDKQDLMEYAKKTLPTITDFYEIPDITKLILDKHSKNKDLTEAIKNIFPQIEYGNTKYEIIEVISDKNITNTNVDLETLLDVAKNAKKAFRWYLLNLHKVRRGLRRKLNHKIRDIEAEIQRRKEAEEAVTTLGFLSKVKQFWNKLTLKKQTPTIIKSA